jgi:hypothetical protein
MSFTAQGLFRLESAPYDGKNSRNDVVSIADTKTSDLWID